MAVGSTGTLSSSSITVSVGESGQITWSGGAPSSIVSANTNIATVTKSGTNSGTITVTGVSVGNTTATIQWAEGTSTISITVAASDDTSFLNKRGLAYFWGKIDNKKQNKLTAGSNITISGDTISASQPTVNNGTLTIQKNGSSVGTFTANQSGNTTANIVVPTKTSDITNDSDFITSSGTVAKANQLTTARTIGISGGVTGTATSFNGTSNISIPVTGMYETYLNWGNQVKNSSVSLIDAAMGEDFAANRLAYLPASCITIEYSRDGGETWVDYGATDAQKINLTTLSQSFYTGGSSSLASGTCQLRVTIAPGNNLYMTTRKLLVNISTNGVSNSKMIIEKRAMGASSFTTERSATTITGWSGWNSFPMVITYGGTASWSNDAIRLTFLYDGKSDSYPNAQLSLSRIRLYGETAWSAPSDLAKNGHLYTFDANKNATFPAQITATRLNGSAQYLEGNSRISSADITHIYTNNQVHQRLDIASGSMSTNKPASDGFINTFMWDNSGNYDAQFFLPNGAYNNSGRPQLRFKADTSTSFNWSTWKSLAYLDDVPTKTSDLTNDSNFPVDASYVHTDNNFTTTLKNKLDGIATGAEVNQNAFSNVKVGSTTVAADSKTDTLELVAGSNVTLTPDATNDKVTIAATVPTVNNGTLTIQKNGSNVATFTANQSGNSTANIVVPTKTSDITNDSNFITDANAQKFAIGQGSTQPVFDDMTPIQTIEWDVSDTTYRPIYQFDNTGWTYTNMDITVAYRVTVTGTNINSVTDVVDRWFNPVSWPLTSALLKTQSTSAATTGLKYLRAVYPTSSYLNNNTYKFGVELEMHNTTARHVKVEVFKTDSPVTWNSTKPSGSIYQGSSTYQSTNNIEIYTTRGWRFRQPVQMYANSASAASYIQDFEAANIAAGDLKTGATALVAGHFAFLADDGLVYDISDTTHNIAVGESKVGFINTGVAANTAISWTYWRTISRPNATQLGYFNHDTFVLGDRVYLRCTMDSNGNVHSDNYLSKTMSAGYTWMPMGWARSATTLYVDTRFPVFYTLDSNGKLTHLNGKELAGSGGSTYVAGNHIDITNDVISAEDYVHSDDPVSTGSITPVVTNGMVANGTLTASKFASGELLTLTMSTTDIGEGAALAANTLYGVYD